MSTIDHQQEAVEAAVDAIARGTVSCAHGYSNLAADDADSIAEAAIAAALPHLRASVAEEVRAIDIPEHRLHDQLPSDHWYAGQKAMRDEIVTLLEGGEE